MNITSFYFDKNKILPVSLFSDTDHRDHYANFRIV
jgi:hypothetical protein